MASDRKKELLDGLISTTKLLNYPKTKQLVAEFGKPFVTEAVRAELQTLRDRIFTADENRLDGIDISPDTVDIRVDVRVRSSIRPSIRPAINAAGIILHTATRPRALCRFRAEGPCRRRGELLHARRRRANRPPRRPLQPRRGTPDVHHRRRGRLRREQQRLRRPARPQYARRRQRSARVPRPARRDRRRGSASRTSCGAAARSWSRSAPRTGRTSTITRRALRRRRP